MTMNYLFLILVFCAVNCEDVGNNYYVVKMPEDSRQQDIKNFKKPFQVYWNVPTMQCASKKIPFQNLFEKFGIIQNDNDKFIGNKIVLIYDEKDFPAVINNKTSGKNILKNGGVPQEGNLKNHLIAFENDLNVKIPDPYFDGMAIIDFESWRPVFLQNFGALTPHKHLSIEIEKQLHNWWPKMWIEKEATLRFEAAARRFMQTTLSMAKELRPNALWGYYGFPYCFNMRNRDMTEKCASSVDKENDSIYWLWAESTALFPSLYSSRSLTTSQLSSLIKGRVKETSRVRGIDTPIFPYFWFRYRDAGFMTEKDLEAALTTLYKSDASGFIIWGSSNDVNTVDKCNKLLKYVETVLGPKIAKYTKKIKSIHSDHLGNKDIYSKETSKAYDLFSNSRSTKTPNTDKMFSTETSTVNNKFTEAEKISQSLNNEMFSTDSTIKYNDYTNSDNLQTLTNLDLSLSGSSTYSEYMNSNQNIPTLNNDETVITESAITYDKDTYIDENLQSLNNDDLFSFLSETSTASYEYTNSDQTSQTNDVNVQNNDEISSNEENTIAYNEYSNTEERAQTLINDDSILSSESSTFDNEKSDHSTKTLNKDKVSLGNLLIKNYVDTINSDNLIYLSKSLIVDYENNDPSTTTLKNEETSLVNTITDNVETTDNVDTINNDNLIASSEFLTFDDENSDHNRTTSNNEETSLKNTITDNMETTDIVETTDNVDIINKDNLIASSKVLIFDDEYSDHSITTSNYEEISLENILPEHFVDIINNDNEISLSKFSNFYYENSDHSTTTSNNDKISLENLSTENMETTDDVDTINNENVISSSKFSNFDYENSDHTTTLNNDLISLMEVSTIDSSNRDESSQTLDYEETTIAYNKYSDTEENVQTLNYDDRISSSESSIIHGNSENSTKILNNDEMTSNKEEIFSKGTSIIYDEFVNEYQGTDTLSTVKNMKDTFPASVEISYTDKSTDIINYGGIITDNIEFKSTENDFLNNNAFFYSSEDGFYYLIEVDNSTNIVNSKQSDYKDSTNVDDDYLILVQNLKNIPNLKENIANSNLETAYGTKQAENNQETVTTSEIYGERSNDLVVTYIDKKYEIKKNEDSISSKAESLQNNVLSNSDDDISDYLIKVDNSTIIQTYYQSDNTNITNGDDDYLVIVTDSNSKEYDKNNIIDNNLNLSSKTQTETDLVSDTKIEDYGVTIKDLDPIVAYINETLENLGFQDPNEDISPEDESLNNNKVLNSDENTFDYLIKTGTFTNKETDKQYYEYKESTDADNDYIIIIKNVDD